MKGAIGIGLAVAAVLLLQPGVRADSSGSVSAVLPIADQLKVTATNISTFEGGSMSGPLATFTDSNQARPAGAFTATMSWGDGTSTTGTVSGGSGQFSVSASHAYAEEGAYTIHVTVQQAPNGSIAGATGTATIADAALSATGVQLSTTKMLHAVVATFTDADPGGASTDYAARIQWGDGTSSAGSIARQGSGFAVAASHTYAHSGTFTVTIVIRDAGGAHTSTTSTITARG
jgi:PKD repeat protein